MSKVITFSRVFPAYHPKAGQPTGFVEKLWQSLLIVNKENEGFKSELFVLSRNEMLLKEHSHWWTTNPIPKNHTIRAGHRWKVGDKFSPVYGRVSPTTPNRSSLPRILR